MLKSSAAERNKEPILKVLQQVIPQEPAFGLEIASGKMILCSLCVACIWLVSVTIYSTTKEVVVFFSVAYINFQGVTDFCCILKDTHSRQNVCLCRYYRFTVRLGFTLLKTMGRKIRKSPDVKRKSFFCVKLC